MTTFKSWSLLLFFWALVALALFVCAPAHAQIAAGSASSSTTTSSSSSSTTTTTAAPQILQLPTMAYQAPLMAPVCPAPTFGAPLGYGRSFGTGLGYGRSFGAGFGYNRALGRVHGTRGFVAGVPTVFVPRRTAVFVQTPAAAVVVPRRTVIRTTPRRQVIKIR